MASNYLVNGTIDLMAGTAGGAASVIVGQPLDTVKVKMQSYPSLYGNAFQCFRDTLARDGIRRGLYAGTTPALAANIAENSVLFCAYGFCQKAVGQLTGKEQNTPLENGVAGFFAAFFSSFTLCPTELIKCKLQALRETGQANSKIGAIALTQQVLRADGVPGLFRGLTSTMMREMPGYFAFFYSVEMSRNLFTNGRPQEAGLLTTIISGGIGGVVFWTVIFPFDVIKSRIQIASSREPMLKLLRHIARTEGVVSLYNGLLPTVLRTFPATGALFVAYKYTKRFMTLGAERVALL